MFLVLMLILSIAIAAYFFYQNRKLKEQLQMMQETLATKERKLRELENAPVIEKEVNENLSSSDDVMTLLNEGLSRTEISKKLGIPVNKLDLIIKFDKIKKEKHI